MTHVDERHLYFAALVGAPWLALGGLALVGCGLLLCGGPEQVLAGGTTLVAAGLAGELAWAQLLTITAPIPEAW
jgi:hypothetical protein